MGPTYRLRLSPSYTCARAKAISLLALATFVGTSLAACSEERASRPGNVVVAERIPATWPSPRIGARSTGPEIEAMRFSTLDIALGSEWNGDAVASLDTTAIDVKTNLFDFTMPRTAPGRFHFAMHVLDLPAFLVRPYALHIVARTSDGRTRTMLVPFRIHGRV